MLIFILNSMTAVVCGLLTLPRVPLAFALQEAPPVVLPGEEPSLRRVGREVLVVAGGEEHVFPGRVGFCAWRRRRYGKNSE